MLNDLEKLEYIGKPTIHTSDIELMNKINEIIINKDIGDGNVFGSNLNFVCDNFKADKTNINQFYIQIIDVNNHKKIEGFNSYVYSNDYRNVVLDLLYGMYCNSYIRIDAEDVRHVMHGKSFEYYKYSINGSLNKEILDKLLEKKNTNNGILICYGNETKSVMETSIIEDALRERENECWLYSYVTSVVSDDDRCISLFIEK